MNSENKTYDSNNRFKVEPPDMDDSESNKSREMQSNSLEVENISEDSISNKFENIATLKDTSYIAELDDNFVCKNIQNEQIHESVTCSLKDNHKGIEIKNDECDKTNEKLQKALFTTINSVDASEASTSQDNSPSSSNDKEPHMLHIDQSKVKRSISKDIYTNNGTPMENSDDSSDEDLSKRQKLNDNSNDTKNLTDDTVTFQKSNSKVRQRNYRKRRNAVSDHEDSSGSALLNEAIREASILDVDEDNTASVGRITEIPIRFDSLRSSLRRDEGSETTSDGANQDEDERDDSSEWTTASEDEMDDDIEDNELPKCLKLERPRPNYSIVAEITKRQIGSNPSFQQRFYGSLHAVERLELMSQLNAHQGCVNALNFNQKGNLLASASDDLAVVIWDWATGKKRHWYESGHCSNMFQAKWLPFDMEYLMVTCGRDGQVRLLDLRHDMSRRIAAHHGPSHKLAVHNETPHVVISVGEDAKILSIDVREGKPNRLLIVKEDASVVQLYSVHSNPCNSNEFCVGGRSHYVRVHDRRKVSPPLYKLCPDHLIRNDYAHVTCAVYNYNGTEILASYNDEDIYLFDRLTSSFHGDCAHSYQGHRNNATVKGVNFFGPKSEYVISGSDCGNIFIWDKDTEAIVQWMTGDQQGVVNCLEGHPHIPVLATSGLDYDVKIWVPSCEKRPEMKHFASCVKANARNRKRENEPLMPNAIDTRMLWILLRHIRNTESARNRINRYGIRDDDDDDEDEYDFDDSSTDNLSEHSDSQSGGENVGRFQCPPF